MNDKVKRILELNPIVCILSRVNSRIVKDIIIATTLTILIGLTLAGVMGIFVALFQWDFMYAFIYFLIAHFSSWALFVLFNREMN